jgi:hypothetical protein
MPLLGKTPGESQTPATEGASQLVENLMSVKMSTREAAISQVLSMGDHRALEAVEDAICRLTGKKNIEFYSPRGMRAGSPQAAYDQVMKLARSGEFSDDPVVVQSLIPGVAFMNQQLMRELAELDAKALAIYQLLGIQMQLKMQVG